MTVLAEDFIVLGGFRSPGLAVVKGAGSPRKWDVRAGYAFTGATVIYTGTDLAKFEVDIFAWEPDHFAAWEVFARAVLSPPVKAAPSYSLAIEHPALNNPPLSILQVVVEDVTQWAQEADGGGLFARTIKLLQYRAPVPVLVKPAQGPPGSPVAVRPPVDPREKIIAENSRRIEELRP
jgi:hypothetical protein